MTPEVTIAIPTYNRAFLLRRALESALSQTFGDIEVVVGDDGSTDGTRVMLTEWKDERLRLVFQPRNRGMHINMNACLDAARGTYFLMLSDDDYLEADCIDSLMGPWRCNDGISMAYGQWWYHRMDGRDLQESLGPDLEEGIDYVLGYFGGKRPTILHGVLFRTEHIRKVGGIPKGYAQDAMLTLRLALEGKVAHVRKPVTHYCLQPGSNTHRISLHSLVRDKESLLDMCLFVGNEKGISPEILKKLEKMARRMLSRDASYGVVSWVGTGGSRADALREGLRLGRYLCSNPAMGIPSLLIAACAPRKVINAMRRFGRRLTGLPSDDVALRLEEKDVR